MQGFKDFIMRGNLIELAVAVIMATSFGAVVEQFTNIMLSIVSAIGGQPNFAEVTLFGLPIGLFINAVITFLITAAVVYFGVVLPYNKLRGNPAPAAPTTDELLTEIRDLLKARNG